MAWRNTSSNFGTFSKTLRWLMALFIITMLGFGLYMTSMPMSPEKLKFYNLHKSFGITILALAIIRLTWRTRNPIPSLPKHMQKLQRTAAHASHHLLYLMMFLMPLSGWAMSSAAGFKVSVFGWITLPALLAPNKQALEFFRDLHSISAYALSTLIVLHIAAALLHHYYYKDNTLTRMLPQKN